MDRPVFIPFDKDAATRIYVRNLPHWRQPGATYFVTFRLCDAIPKNAARELAHQRDLWLRHRGVPSETPPQDVFAMLSRSDRFLFRKHLNRLREEVHDAGYGECWLRRKDVLEVIREQIFRGDGDAYHLGDFILMPNHVHLLVVPAGRELEQCMRQIKGASAKFCNEVLGRRGMLWQADSYDHVVRNVEQLAAYREYIRANPEKAGIESHDGAYYRAEWLGEQR